MRRRNPAAAAILFAAGAAAMTAGLIMAPGSEDMPAAVPAEHSHAGAAPEADGDAAADHPAPQLELAWQALYFRGIY